MSRVPLIQPEQATPAIRTSLAAIQKALGATPNMFKAVANSPAALTSMWGSFGALGAGQLGAQLGEQIAVAIADRNRCDYCLAAHHYLGKGAGLSEAQLHAAQAGQSQDPRTAAALSFALAIVEHRGQVSTTQVQLVRAAGFSDEQIVEIVAHVALNLFTNYVNIVFDVPVDFPKIALLKAA